MKKIHPYNDDFRVLDRHPDLTLIMKQDNEGTTNGSTKDKDIDEVVLEVCSKTLSRHSKFFESMLYGLFKERRPNDGLCWRVTVEVDHLRAARVIARYLHNMDPAPLTGLGIDEKYAVTEMAVYFSCQEALRNLIRTVWIEEIEDAFYRTSQNACGKLLYVASRLGLEDRVQLELNALQRQVNMAVPMAGKSARDTAAPITFAGGKPMTFDPVLEDFMLAATLQARRDILWEAEKKTIKSKLHIYRTALCSLLPQQIQPGQPRSPLQTCQSSCSMAVKLLCHDALAGSLWRQVSDQKLDPRTCFADATYNYMTSARSFKALNSIQPQGLDTQSLNRKVHASCNPMIRVRKALDDLGKNHDSTESIYNQFELQKPHKKFMQDGKDTFGVGS